MSTVRSWCYHSDNMHPFISCNHKRQIFVNFCYIFEIAGPQLNLSTKYPSPHPKSNPHPLRL